MTSSSSSSSSAANAGPVKQEGAVDPALLAGGKKFAVDSVVPGGDDDYDTSDSEFAGNVLGGKDGFVEDDEEDDFDEEDILGQQEQLPQGATVQSLVVR